MSLFPGISTPNSLPVKGFNHYQHSANLFFMLVCCFRFWPLVPNVFSRFFLVLWQHNFHMVGYFLDNSWINFDPCPLILMYRHAKIHLNSRMTKNVGSKRWSMNFLVSRKYFAMLNNAHLVRWQSQEPKVVTRWYAITVGSTFATVATKKLMDMIILGKWFIWTNSSSMFGLSLYDLAFFSYTYN